MTKEEKLSLYYEAKQAYYDSSPIMGDSEFDALEEELGLENKSVIGSGKTANYTIKHPFIMGSLSKVQIKESKNGDINWLGFMSEINSYLSKSKYSSSCVSCIITPKYDGCSFEYYYNNGEISISTRGDGEFGKDIKKHLEKKCLEFHKVIGKDEFTLRGEVLIDKDIFQDKYSSFTNPRSFVAGILNRKYDDITDLTILDDLSLIIYDYRVKENGEWQDYDWLVLKGRIPMCMLPEYHEIKRLNVEGDLACLYKNFDNYRSVCKFALDGIVIKPKFEYRNLNLTKSRPDDCVAIKFLPTIKETTVIDIEWQLGKTGEYTPVVIFEEIILDGKKVNKASAHNYGFIVDNHIAIGSKIKISLAGDIIPYIYEVVTKIENGDLGDFLSEGKDFYIDGCHLMKKLNLVEKMEIDFLASCKSLNINGIGDKQAKQIFDSLEYKVEHIFFVGDDQIIKALNRGEGKTANNAIKALAECKEKKNLTDVIASMNIKDCGMKTSEQCAKYLIDQNIANFSGLSNTGWQWVIDACLPFDIDNDAHHTLDKLLSLLRHKDNSKEGHELDKYIMDYSVDNSNLTKVILTGSPSRYVNKREFLLKHPEYIETSKWSECQILFTGDIHSQSSKMNKAKKLGIEIKEY